MKLSESTLNSTKRVLAERRVQKYLKEGLNKDQIQAKLIEEGFGNFIRKGVDKVKGMTGLGMTAKNRQIKEKIRSKYSVFMEYMNEEMPTARELSIAIDRMAAQGKSRTSGRGYEHETFKDFPKKKRGTLMGTDRTVRKRIDKMQSFIIAANKEVSNDKTVKKLYKFTNALMKELSTMEDVLYNFKKEAFRAQKTGETEGAQQLAKELRAAEVARERAANIAFAADQAAGEKADRERRRKARNANRKDDEMSFTGGQMSTKSRYAE